VHPSILIAAFAMNGKVSLPFGDPNNMSRSARVQVKTSGKCCLFWGMICFSTALEQVKFSAEKQIFSGENLPFCRQRHWEAFVFVLKIPSILPISC
jgi:hypothetical protein